MKIKKFEDLNEGKNGYAVEYYLTSVSCDDDQEN